MHFTTKYSLVASSATFAVGCLTSDVKTWTASEVFQFSSLIAYPLLLNKMFTNMWFKRFTYHMCIASFLIASNVYSMKQQKTKNARKWNFLSICHTFMSTFLTLSCTLCSFLWFAGSRYGWPPLRHAEPQNTPFDANLIQINDEGGRFLMSECPGRKKGGHHRDFDEDLKMLTTKEEFQVTLIVSNITDMEIDLKGLREKFLNLSKEYGVEWVHLPIRDYWIPLVDDQERFLETLKYVHKRRMDGANVLVHCNGRKGRSGIFSVVYLIAFCGYSASEAITHIRKCRPRLTRSPLQILFMHHFQLCLTERWLKIDKMM